MHILGLVAENVKKIRVVEIEPKGRVIQITGKNGQGKTSVLDSIWYALEGKKSLPDKPVRKGADKARIKLTLGTKEKGAELFVTRTIQSDKTISLSIEAKDGHKYTSPQAMLDDMMGALTFDPMQFVTMKAKEQVNALRSMVKLDIDTDALNAANAKDFDERRIVNRDVDRLRAEVAAITVLDGLPKERIDEAQYLDQLQRAGELNKLAQEIDAEKAKVRRTVDAASSALSLAVTYVDNSTAEVAELEERLADAKKMLAVRIAQRDAKADELKEAEQKYRAAPDGQQIDVTALTQELQKVQITNREIDKRNRRATLEAELKTKTKDAEKLTRNMEDREEKKRVAIASAKMPLPDLTFDDDGVLYKGIPLDQAGEAEQLRVSVALAMAANPKLRILRVMHGEAMDDDALSVLATMAEEHDFQVWIAKVDSSGKVGIVMEDGQVKSESEAE